MTLIKTLEKRLQLPLPGVEAQAKMAHIFRTEDIVVPNHSKKAAVLILLYRKNEEFHTILMKRTSRFPNDKHKGQISFPGGQYEKTDIDFSFTAIRETEEEIGINASKINLLGQLTQLYIPVSNFLVYPFVGYMDGMPNFNPDAKEVDEVIEARLSDFFNQGNRKEKEMEFSSGFRIKNVPYFDIKGHVVWGATSMIMSEFLHLFENTKTHQKYF